MQDASNDLMQTICPHALPLPPEGIFREPSPRLFHPPRLRSGKGKQKAFNLDDIYVAPPPAGPLVGRCRWDTRLGYVCEICSRVCTRPDLHRASVNGTTCLDYSGVTAPLKREVKAEVARDPERAFAEADAMRANQGGWMFRASG